MDPTFGAVRRDASPLSKRRRFIPDSTLAFAPYSENVSLDSQDCDSPLLLQVNGRTPTQQDIEAELLQVGMRIRKAVNDGYKTSAFTPRPFFNMARLSPETQAALISGTLKRQPLATASFCGISLAALSHIKSTPVEAPQLWRYSTSHKRGYEGDSDSDDQEFMPHTPTLGHDDNEMTSIPVDYFNINFDNDGEVSPMTQVYEQQQQQQAPHLSGRRMAKPKSRKQRTAVQDVSSNPFAQIQLPSQMGGTQWMGHKRVTSCHMEANLSYTDFGEASFLQRREDIDMDCS